MNGDTEFCGKGQNVFLILVNEGLITAGRPQKLTGEVWKKCSFMSKILGYQSKEQED
jgi:hypothetical protein